MCIRDSPKTVRASAGSLFHIPFSVQEDPAALATALRSVGYRTLATVVREGDDYAGLDWSVPTALFLGNESSGLDEQVRAAIGGALAIPMAVSYTHLDVYKRQLFVGRGIDDHVFPPLWVTSMTGSLYAPAGFLSS